MSCLTSVNSQYVYSVHGISNPLRWSYLDSKWWAISTQLTQCNIPAEQKSVLKRIRSLANHSSYLLLQVGANVSEVNIIHPIHCTCNHYLHITTYAHNKLESHTKTCTLLHVLILILIYFTFNWSYTDVELVMYTFSIINKASVHKLCLIVVS